MGDAPHNSVEAGHIGCQNFVYRWRLPHHLAKIHPITRGPVGRMTLHAPLLTLASALEAYETLSSL